MLTYIKQMLRWLLSRTCYCCEKCGKSASREIKLRKAGTLLFRSMHVCQSCAETLYKSGIYGQYVVDNRRENYGDNTEKKLALKRQYTRN